MTGDVQRADDTTIWLETEYAGVITIRRDRVQSLRHDDPALEILTESGRAGGAEARPNGDPFASPRETAGWTPAAAAPAEATDQLSPEAEKRVRSTGRVQIAFLREEGNADKRELDVNYLLDLRLGWHRLDSTGVLELDTFEGDETTDNWGAFNRYSRHARAPWYEGLWLAIQHDRFADRRLRTFTGPVIGYQAWEREERNLSIEGGPIYLNENFYDQPDLDFWGPAAYLNFDQFLWPDRLQVYLRAFLFLGVNDSDKRLWRSWVGFRVPGAGGFVSSVEYEVDHDSQPAVEAETTDTALRLMMGYQW